MPPKFLIPGTFLLLAFQAIPIVYTVDVAFSNWSTGHIIKKPDAIRQIMGNSLAEADNGKTFTMSAAHDSHGKLALLLTDDQTGKTFVGTSKALTPVPKSAFADYTVLKAADVIAAGRELTALVVPSGHGNGIRAEGLSTAVELHPTLRYDPARDTFTRIGNGLVFHDNNDFPDRFTAEWIFRYPVISAASAMMLFRWASSRSRPSMHSRTSSPLAAQICSFSSR